MGFASAEEIDALNIIGATGLAMRRAVAAMGTLPAFALVDGNYAFDLPCPVRPVVGGDGMSLSIAAASILAKVARDRVMVEMDALHPGYGFAAHKGYGVRRHAEALAALGPCAIHRRSWTPIRAMLEGGAPNPSWPASCRPPMNPALAGQSVRMVPGTRPGMTKK